MIADPILGVVCSAVSASAALRSEYELGACLNISPRTGVLTLDSAIVHFLLFNEEQVGKSRRLVWHCHV